VWWARTLAPWALGGLFRRSPVSDPLYRFRPYRAIVLKKVFRGGGGDVAGFPEQNVGGRQTGLLPGIPP